MRIENPISKYSEEQARKNLKKGIPLTIIPYAFVLVTNLYYLPFYVDLGILAPSMNFLAGIVFMYGLMKFYVPYQHWKSGLNGERKVVDNISSKLGYEHTLFNDVLLKDGQRGGNIDHIIVGPRGIFAIETKNIQGAVSVNGDNWKGVRNSPSLQAKNHARRIYNILNNSNVLNRQIPYVNPIVVLSSKKTQFTKEREPNLCKIIQIKDQSDNSLYEYIMQHNEIVFSTEEIEVIVQFLKDKTKN
jgi:hypothetical protein